MTGIDSYFFQCFSPPAGTGESSLGLLLAFHILLLYMIYIAPISTIALEALASLGGEHD